MSQSLLINKKIKILINQLQLVEQDLSIRWVYFLHLQMVFQFKNLLISEDVTAAINAVRKLGIR